MPKTRKTILTTGTFAAALAVGVVMQDGEAIASRFIDTEDASTTPVRIGDPGPEVTISLVPGFTELPAIEATPSALPGQLDRPDPPKEPTRLAALDLRGELEPVTGTAADGCKTSMTAEVRPAALVEVTLEAPCAAHVPVTVHHKGLMFTLVTDGAGRARALVPALSEEAVFIAALAERDGAVATASVPEVGRYDRAALQWRGDAGLTIHAFEFGAGYDSEGHVWRTAARSPSSGQGFLVGLGDATAPGGYRAEVYSYPLLAARHSGMVELSVEAAIGEANCGKEIAAQSIQVWPDQPAETRDLTMTVPACDSEGGFLLLKNLLKDLKIGAR